MGQLRAGILGLQKVLIETEPKLKKVEETLRFHSDRITELTKKTGQGYDVLYLYLIQKFKKDNTTPQAQQAKTLQQVMDPTIQKTLAGIKQWKQDLKVSIARMNSAMDGAKGEVLTSVTFAENHAAQLKALAEKKKDKFFKSAKYKDRIKSYLAALESVFKIVKTQKATVKSATSKFTDAWVDKNFAIGPEMTVGKLVLEASMDLDSSLKTYEQNKSQIDMEVRKFRDEYKSIPGQLAVMQKWINEADAMEAEAI